MYCKNCGAALDEGEKFCAKCGMNIETGKPGNTQPLYGAHIPPPVEAVNEPFEKLMVELAYSGLFFWLPLATKSRHRHARYCANQGLWLMIVAAVPCFLMQAFGQAKDALDGGWLGTIANMVYVPVFIAFLFFLLFLTYKAYRGAMAVHRGEKPDGIPFFDRFALIQ